MTMTARPWSRSRSMSARTCCGLGDAQRGGRLVEDDHPRLAQQRPRDRHGLALAARERADLGAHAEQRRDRQLGEQLRRALLHRDLVEHAHAARGPGASELAPEEEVGDDVEVVAQREVLVHGGDARAVASAGHVDLDRAAVAHERAGVGGLDPGDRLDERRLAGAVVADQGDDLAGVISKSTSTSACTAPNRLLTPLAVKKLMTRAGTAGSRR